MTDDELEKLIKELPKKPLATGTDELRFSLAGVQDKTAVTLIDGKIALPKGNAPTTHILKPAIQELEETVENEYICLKTAERMGIKVPKIEIRKVNGTKFFLIERYDRKINNGYISRIHQEDFCQAYNIMSSNKYQSEGGVSLKMCYDLVRKTSQPANNLKQLTELVIFNYLIGNKDAHGKNY